MTSSKKTQKNHQTILGWIDKSYRRRHLCIEPFHKDFSGSIFIHPAEIKKSKSDLHTIVRASLRKAKGNQFEAKILQTYPSFNDPELEREVVRELHGFPVEFSDSTLKEAEAVRSLPPGKRRDLTHCTTVTIDGETAKDFDDAISVEKKGSDYLLRVSIADVSHYVRKGSALDLSTQERGTSIYFPGHCVPMLPEILSNDLCSLVPHRERLALTAEITISKAGELKSSQVYPSTIKSQARLTYTQVGAFLDRAQDDFISEPIRDMLRLAFDLSQILRERRARLGSLDLDIPELETEVNDLGDIVDIRPTIRNEAHRLIEDFMVVANEAVSELIEAKGFPSIYRIHESPDPLKLMALESMTRSFGLKLDLKQNVSVMLQKLLNDLRKHPFEKPLLISVLRSMKRAVYSPHNVGHFGLGSRSYCHFTSPIRRYPDLIIHRILRDSDFLKSKKPPYSLDDLLEISEKSTATERRAFLAERDMEDIKKARFLNDFVGKQFNAMVSSIKHFGIFVEIEPYGIEGLLPIRLLPPGRWEVNEMETKIECHQSKKRLQIGDRIRVRLEDVNRLKRQITFRYLMSLPSPKMK